MKVINDLVKYSGIKIVQDNDYFNFSLDSILLPNFVTINKNTKTIMDLCTGNAPIPLILNTKTDAKIYGMEIQSEVHCLAIETLKMNKLEKEIDIINDDIKNIDKYFQAEYFDIITCNPPYFKMDKNSNLNLEEIKTIARHEKKITLEEVISISSTYLKYKGILAMIHRTDRLIEIISLFQKYDIEPKKIRLIYPKKDKDSTLVLIEGMKGGKTGLKFLSPLIVHDEKGNYTKEVLKYFGEEE